MGKKRNQGNHIRWYQMQVSKVSISKCMATIHPSIHSSIHPSKLVGPMSKTSSNDRNVPAASSPSLTNRSGQITLLHNRKAAIPSNPIHFWWQGQPKLLSTNCLAPHLATKLRNSFGRCFLRRRCFLRPGKGTDTRCEGHGDHINSVQPQ